MIDAKFFSTEKELSKLTGLDHEQLWENDFNLDDWDWGIQIPSRKQKQFERELRILLNMMDSYCVGYKKTIYKDNAYYIQYHA